MAPQDRVIALFGVTTVLAAFLLWTLINSGNFLPYLTEGTPNLQNVITFIVLLTFFITGALTLLVIVSIALVIRIKKSERKLSSAELGVVGVVIFFSVLMLLVLHIFSIISWQLVVLSYALFWSIVGYGKYKERNRFAKYLAANPGTRKTEAGEQVRDQQSPVHVGS